MNSDRSDRVIGLSFFVSVIAALSAAFVYAFGGQPQLEGAFLGTGLGALGVGLILWAKHLLPGGHDTQMRGNLAPTSHEESAAEESLERGVDMLERRSFLLKMGAAAAGALGLAALFPVQSLGRRKKGALLNTAWSVGVRVVDSEGHPIRHDDIEIGQVTTVYPETDVGGADAVTLLIGLDPGADRPIPGRDDWSIGNVVAYSKLCTHVGCPVGLYKPTSHELFCPCHQSVFDVTNGARPTGGPATRALPQLPITVDGEGFIVARGDFSEAPGPGFWSRPRND